jgi:hypothetical protein
MIRRGGLGRPRFPLLHGWWIAVAQNVAPRRFHARECRRHEEDNRRVLTSSDIPTFALAGSPSPETATSVVLKGMTATRSKNARRWGLCRFVGGVVTSLHTTQPTPGGGELEVTSQRRRTDIPIEAGWDRALMIHNFLNRSGHATDDARVARREVALCPGQSYPLLSVSEDAWIPCRILINGEPEDFERTTIGDHWLALGTVDDVEVAIAGHSFDPHRLELVRLDCLAG